MFFDFCLFVSFHLPEGSAIILWTKHNQKYLKMFQMYNKLQIGTSDT